jgi:hypothetical protein
MVYPDACWVVTTIYVGLWFFLVRHTLCGKPCSYPMPGQSMSGIHWYIGIVESCFVPLSHNLWVWTFGFPSIFSTQTEIPEITESGIQRELFIHNHYAYGRLWKALTSHIYRETTLLSCLIQVFSNGLNNFSFPLKHSICLIYLISIIRYIVRLHNAHTK